MKVYNSILNTIGNTPLVKIQKLNPNPNVTLLAKLEWLNPMGSVKERIALAMVEAAERDGSLTKDKIILESSSGNTGIGLAMVGAVKGYKVVIVMSEGVSIERRQIMEALGAEVISTSKEGGSDEAWAKADELTEKFPEKYCRLSQYRHPANVQTHYERTAQEIWEDTEGKVDVVVGPLGTTGTIVGVSRRLKELNPKVRIVAVEPQPGKHKQQGIRNLTTSRMPDIWDGKSVDMRLVVKDEDAFRMTRELARQEGLFGGISSGTAVHAALIEVRRLTSGVIVVILPDNGFKYLSTGLFQ